MNHNFFLHTFCSALLRPSSFHFIVSIDPNRLHASAYFATILSVFLSPLPPINIGREGFSCCSILYSELIKISHPPPLYKVPFLINSRTN